MTGQSHSSEVADEPKTSFAVDGTHVVALLSCVKSKRSTAAPAADLYVSALFRGMRKYAESRADSWYVLSAEHGMLEPERVIEPYERTLKTMSVGSRLAWATRVQAQLLQVLPAHADIIILAGLPYREGIVSVLRANGHAVKIPMEGLSFGRQLSWLKQQA